MKGNREFESPLPIPEGSCIVMGFMGGVDRWNDATQGVRRIALRIRNHAKARYVETFENRAVDKAMRFLEATGVIGPGARNGPIVLYGQSLGGSVAIRLARHLAQRRVMVALTVQVDSVGWGGSTIPGNVRYAANFFQDQGFLVRGIRRLEVADPEHTTVLGNWRWRSRGKEVVLPAEVTWWKAFFQKVHLKMVHDQRVWQDVEDLIVSLCEGRPLAPVAEFIQRHWD